MNSGIPPRPGNRSQSFLARLRRKSRLLHCVTLLVMATLVPGPGFRLMAAPPLEIDPLGGNRIQLSWPDTPGEVRLETSGDLGQTLPWIPFAIPPMLSGGRFSQEIEVGPMSSFFRLADETGGTQTPTFNDPPPANPSLFPGEELTFTLSATDPGGAPVSYLAEPLPLPTGASLNMSTGVFRWTPSAEQTGLTKITFMAYNGTDSGLLPVNITVKQAPLNGTTSLSGILLDTTNAVIGEQVPIVGAVVSLLDSGITATTGEDGRFTLSGIPGGTQVLDLATAQASPAPDGSGYAGFREAIKIVAGIPNNVTRPFYLPRLAMGSLKKVNPDFTTLVENTDLGVSIVVPPHTAMMGDEEFTGELSISLVPEALAPAALPENLGFGQLVTIQPVGVRFTEPVPITFKNIDQLPPGSETDIWSLDPDAGVFAVVGKGKVTEDGQFIETIEGGVIAADWHGALSPGADGDGGDGGGGGSCPTGFGSQVGLFTGTVLTSFELDGYRSFDEFRRLKFQYSSNAASPEIVLPFDATISVRAAVPETISHQISLGGIRGPEVFTATTGLSESRDETVRLVANVDAGPLPTGIYPFDLTLTSNYARSSVGTNVMGTIPLLNTSDSPFGAGWELIDFPRIIGTNNPGRYVVTDESGSVDVFNDSPFGESVTFGAFGSDRIGSLSPTEGSQFDTLRARISSEFPATFVSVNELSLAALSGVDILLIHPQGSAVTGNPLSSAEQTALVEFARRGGCVVMAFDHDLGRSSFAEANATLAAPFGVTTTNSAAITARVGDQIGFSDGNFGLITELPTPFGGARFSNSGTGEIISSDAEGGTLNYIAPGTLAAGAGPVLMIPDIHMLVDGLITESSGAFMLNFFNVCGRTRNTGTDELFVQEGDVDSAPGESTLFRKLNGTFELRRGQKTYRFDITGNLTAIEEQGRLMTYTYSGGLLSRITDAAGKATQFAYSEGVLTRITSPSGAVTQFTVTDGNLVAVEYPNGTTKQFGYNDRHRMTSETNEYGESTLRTYNGLGRAVTAQLSNGGTRKIEPAQLKGFADQRAGVGTEANPAPPFRPENATTEFTDGEGRLTVFSMSAEGKLEQITRPDASVGTFEYDSLARPTTFKFPDGRNYAVQTSKGRVDSITDQNVGGTFAYTYDPEFDLPTSAHGFQFDYDSEGRLLERTTPAGRQDVITRTANGLPDIVTQFSGLRSDYRYDVSGNTETVEVGPVGSQRSYGYTLDDRGRVTGFTNPLRKSASYVYDGNFLTSATLPGNRVVSRTSPGKSRVVSITPPGKFAYEVETNGFGSLVGFRPPAIAGQDTATAYLRNKEDQVTRLDLPDGRMVDYAYNAAGKLVTATLGRGTMTYTYDATTGQLTRVADPNQNTVNYEHRGDLLTKFSWTGEVAGEVSRTFRGDYTVGSMNIAGNQVAFNYDADSALTAAGAMQVTRDPSTGAQIGTTLGSIRTELSFNEFSELTSHRVLQGATVIMNSVYTRDATGRVTEVTETISGTAATRQYTYDIADNLASVNDGGTLRTYTYDANGNRLTRGGTAGTTIYQYDVQERISATTGAESATFTHYGSGDMRARTGTNAATFEYDELGALVSVQTGGQNIAYVLDPEGRRIGKKVGGTLTKGWLYSGEIVVGELAANGTLDSYFVYGSRPNVPDYMVKGGQSYRIISDQRGSVRLVIDAATGSIAQRLDYDEFGRVLADSNPGFQPFAFAGGLYDQHTKLLRFGARDYDPNLGRWLARDEVINFPVTNFYTYCLNDPVNLIDYDGRLFWVVVLAVIATTTVVVGLKSLLDEGKAATAPQVGNQGTQDQQATRNVQQLGNFNDQFVPAVGRNVSNLATSPGTFIGGPVPTTRFDVYGGVALNGTVTALNR